MTTLTGVYIEMHNAVLDIVRPSQMRWTAVLPFILVVAGCAEVLPHRPISDLSETYVEVRIDIPAAQITLQPPHNKLKLSVTPFNGKGLPLADEAKLEMQPVQWTSTDTSAAVISSDGSITPKKISNRVEMIARLKIGDITHYDTAWIRILDVVNPDPIDELKIIAPSPIVRTSSFLTIGTQGMDEGGKPMTGIPVKYTSSNKDVALFRGGLGVLRGLVPDDSVLITVESMIYGKEVKDSIVITTGWPLLTLRTVFKVEQRLGSHGKREFHPRLINLKGGPGSSFTWQNTSGFAPRNGRGVSAVEGVTIDVIFDDPEAAESAFPGLPSPLGDGGNIIGLLSDTTLAVTLRNGNRVFRKPGVYHYTVEPFGYKGFITISER